MKNYHSKSHVPLFLLAISTTLLVGGLYGYINYRIKDIGSKSILARGVVASEKADKGHNQDLVDLYNATVQERAELKALFVPADDLVGFIESVESTGQKSGSNLSLSSIDIVSATESSAAVSGMVKAKVGAQGSWPSVMRALKLAEALPYNVSLNNVRLESSVSAQGGSSNREWSLSYDITASTVGAAETSTNPKQ